MEDHQVPVGDKPARRPPWNKGKLVGAKPPLRPSHVWSIRTKLQMQGRQRDLALFNRKRCPDSTFRPSSGCGLMPGYERSI